MSDSRTPLYAPLRHNGRALREAVSHTAALLEDKHVLACTGWAGEIAGLIEHSLLCLNVSGYLTDWDAIEQILDCSTDPFLTIPFGQHEDI